MLLLRLLLLLLLLPQWLLRKRPSRLCQFQPRSLRLCHMLPQLHQWQNRRKWHQLPRE